MTPNILSDLYEKVNALFPLPYDLATREPSSALGIIGRMKDEEMSFFELPSSDFQLAYQISSFLGEKEFPRLSAAFQQRADLMLFKIGWIYCQYHPDETRAVSLFSTSCEWAKRHHETEYGKTLVGRTGLPWEQIYNKSVQIMRADKLSVASFCKEFDILTDTLFYERLALAWFSVCGKDDFLETEYESLFSGLILRADSIYLRPAIVNCLNQIHFDNISPPLHDALVRRARQEKDGKSLGLSPAVLQKIRRQHYGDLLKASIISDKEKLSVYTSVCDRIRRIEKLKSGFFLIDFTFYIVIDCDGWETYSYAYEPALYTTLYNMWESEGFSPDFWPGVQEKEISSARDIVLGMKKTGAVILNLSGFDALYAKDLLNNIR